jgi:hypothetical protein
MITRKKEGKKKGKKKFHTVPADSWLISSHLLVLYPACVGPCHPKFAVIAYSKYPISLM